MAIFLANFHTVHSIVCLKIGCISEERVLNFRELFRNYIDIEKVKKKNKKGDFVERERFKVVLYLCRSTASCHVRMLETWAGEQGRYWLEAGFLS